MDGVTLVMAVLILLVAKQGDATTYIVGGSDGWKMNMKGWPNGKVFKVGDVLKFNYDQNIHNVVAVDEVSYRSCTAPKDAKVFNSGNDDVVLSTGYNFFVCSLPGHCQAGMKIVVVARAA